jgi:hypothetical protein
MERGPVEVLSVLLGDGRHRIGTDEELAAADQRLAG